MEDIDERSLHNRWVHSHEEDKGKSMVFRPATFAFPPSRGRTSFELKSDGTLVEQRIAHDDRHSETQGVWKVEGDRNLVFYTHSNTEPSQTMQIVSAEPDRLVVTS